jgi:bifunctional non-homologous end joining protein LigD
VNHRSRSPYQPQLATLVDAPPSGDEWLHEIKFDGYRIGCVIRNGRVTLLTRNGNDWTTAFSEVATAAARLGVRDALIDGEVVMLLPDGRTSFQALQNASSGTAARAALVYFVFDLLRLDGERLEHLALEERKDRLSRLVGRETNTRIRYANHVIGQGRAFFKQACGARLEGIVSKRRDLPYVAGRHGGWLKTKCKQRQEFVVGGFTDPEGMRAGLGALLVGYYENDRLIFSGKVGTGFTQQGALELRRKLNAIEQPASPFSPPPPGAVGRTAHWVKPALVAEVEFTEWTSDGKIRHPSFQGLRGDKKPRDVVRERSQQVPAEKPLEVVKVKTGGTPRRRLSEARPIVVGVGISNADRVVYPSPTLTKLDIARYYESIQRWVVPHVAGRPLTLVRCPEGLPKDCFYMKHSPTWAHETLRRVRIREKKKVGEYLIADDIAGIVGLVQMGVLEIHTWNSRFEDLERPNRIVIDLDPGDNVAWPDVIAAARAVRAAFEALDLESWVKTTGGRGLHVVVPLLPQADWSECLAFSRGLGEALERTEPRRYTTVFAKAGRSRKILIDYLRNNRTNTSIAAYSTRARSGAPVSVPVRWEDLRASLEPGAFSVLTVPGRLGRLAADPWKGYWTCRQRLTRQRLKAVGAVGQVLRS